MTPKITRRQFIAGTLATGAALYSPALLADSGRTLKSMTQRVEIGKTGVKASYLGLGTGTVGFNGRSNQTRMGTVGFAIMVRHALDCGVNYFDVADIYGTHQYLRASLKGVPRESYVIESKIWFRTSKDAQADLDRFLTELNTDYIDIVYLHCVTDTKWAADLRAMEDVLEAAKCKKVIRAHGISVHDLNVLKGAADNPWVDNVLARINPAGVNMDGKPEEVVPALGKLHAAGKGVTGIKILGEGKIADRREESLKYVLGLDCVDAIVIGFESPAQIDEIINMGNRALARK
jgi:predicted aldo/keto reductase-like oxidoreductase